MASKKKEGAAAATAAQPLESLPEELQALADANVRADDEGAGMDGGMLDDGELVVHEEPASVASEKKEGGGEPAPVGAVDAPPAPIAPPPPAAEPMPEGMQVLIVQRPTANRHLVWAVIKGHEIDGPVKLRVRAADFYNRGEEVQAVQVERDTWEATTHRKAPRFPRRPPLTSR